jgi:hypothetical protein
MSEDDAFIGCLRKNVGSKNVGNINQRVFILKKTKKIPTEKS